MKKLLYLLVLLISVSGFAQTIPDTPIIPIQQSGGPGKMVLGRDIQGAYSGVAYYGAFTDTTAANISPYYKNIAGMTVRTGNTLWIRDTTLQYWIEFGAGSLNIDTTQSILLSGDGSSGNPLTANLTISSQIGNIIQLFPDGVYAATGQDVDCQNGLMSGGRIILEQNLDYTVTPATYGIGCAPYASVETLITLDASDPVFDRIDLVVVDTNNNVVVITGTPSDDPQNPSFDPLSQLPLSFILVTANATEPAFCRDSIYYISNGQTYTGVVSNAGRINTTSTNNPFSVTEDVEFTLAQNNDQYRVTKSTPIAFATYSVLTFKIRSKATWATNSRVNIRVYAGLTPLGINVALGDGIFGFNSSITNAYQTIVIPIGNLGGGLSTGDNILFTISTTTGNTIGFYLDNIQLLGCEGTPVPVSGRFWAQGGDSWGTLGVIGTLDNFGMQHVVNNTNHFLLQPGGGAVLQGATPRLSLFLGTGGNADYFIDRSGTTIRMNTAGDYLARVAGNTMYQMGVANGHLWNTSAAVNIMQLNNTTGALRLFNYGDNTFTGTATRWLAVDVNGNVIEQAPPVAAITANNGLSTSTSTNTQLGGNPLLFDTDISTSAFSFTMNSSSSTATIRANNSGTGSAAAILGVGGNGGIGVNGQAIGNSGIGVDAILSSGSNGFALRATNSGTSGYGAYISHTGGATGGTPLYLQKITTTGTNTTLPLLTISRATSGTPAIGLGSNIDFYIDANGGDEVYAGSMVTKWTNATLATVTSQISFVTLNSGLDDTRFAINGNGSLQAADYGVGAFTGTPTFTLQVDASGNIIEGAVGAGTGDVVKVGTPVNNQVAVWTGDPTLEGDPALTFTGGALTVGLAGTTLGQLVLSGNTAQTVTLRTLATAGNYTLTFPTTDGNAGEVLSTDGSGGLSWIAAGAVGTVTNVTWTGGIVSIANPTTVPAFTIAGTSGGIPYFSSSSTWATSAALAANALVIGGGAGTAPSTTTTASGILTWLGTPSSANLRTAVTDESGTGALYFQSGDLGTPTAGTISTGVTLGDVTVNVTGTDATADIYYRGAGGLLTRLPVGTAGQILRVNAGVTAPEWATISGSGTMTSATLTQPAAGITITNSGVAQTTVASWTVALANDLAGLEAATSQTGLMRRTATNVYSYGTAVGLTTEVTGTLPSGNGGTGFGSGYTAGQILWASNATTLTRGFLLGTSNQINVSSLAGGITLSMAFNPTEQTLSDAGTTTWNVTNGGNSVWTNSGTGRTLTLSNLVAGYSYTLRLIQGAGGSHTVNTWTNVRWANGTTPTLSTVAGRTDMITFYCVNSTYLVGYFTPNVQ